MDDLQMPGAGTEANFNDEVFNKNFEVKLGN
jgi:hypothetical protein